MTHLIDKDALVAEIEKVIDEPAPSHDQQCPWEDGYYCGLYKAESIIDTLEVKEVDLDEIKIGETQIFIEDDGGEPPYDGKQWLDIGCSEYGIPEDKFKDGDNVEIIIRKIRK